MQNKALPIIITFVMALLAGHSAVWAGPEESQQPLQKRTEATIQELGQLDSRIEILKKELEIKELEGKIAKAENEKKSQVRSKQNAMELSRRLGQRPFGGRPVPKPTPAPKRPAPQKRPNPQKMRPGPQKQQQDAAQAQQFDQYLVQARVVSVSGIDGNVRAEIRLPHGGSLAVKEGQDTGRLGKVKTVSLDNVVVEKHGKSFHIPFSEEFKEFSAAVKSTQQEQPGFAPSPQLSADSADVPPDPPPQIPE